MGYKATDHEQPLSGHKILSMVLLRQPEDNYEFVALGFLYFL